MTAPLAPSLDLGLVGNGTFGALFDARARLVWSCLPAFDGDPAFCALLGPKDQVGGDFAVELEDLASTDELTGLYNRRRFLRIAEGDLSRLRKGHQSGLALIDLDRKAILRMIDAGADVGGVLAGDHHVADRDRA